MDNLRKCNQVWVHSVVVSALLLAPCAYAELLFNKLDSCEEIEGLQKYLANRPKAIDSECRLAKTDLERSLKRRAGIDASKLCLMRSNPSPMLNDFSCFRILADVAVDGTILTCFRAAVREDIDDYQHQYAQKYANARVRYLASAVGCGVSNGDSSDSTATLFPPVLKLISQYEFGFIMGLGVGRPAKSSISHGYAATDPTIRSNVPSAIEYVSLLIGSTPTPINVSRKEIGNWSVLTRALSEIDDVMGARFRRLRIAVKVRTTEFEIYKLAGRHYSEAEKLALIEKLQEKIARLLEEEGFYSGSEKALIEELGLQSEGLIDEMNRSVPFGDRRRRPARLSSKLVLMANEERPVCASRP